MSEPSKIIRVLIADDHPVMRKGLRAVLEETLDIEVVGEAKDGVETRRMVVEFRPNILLLDLVMPDLRPFEVEKLVRANHQETITLILTAHDRDYYLAEAVETGAAGFLTKDESPQKLVEAIRRAACGEVLITGEQLARAYSWRREVGERWESLTEREREVLRLLVKGQSNAAISEELCITVGTVECHVTSILSKLNVTSRQEAIVWVKDHHLLDDL